MKPPPNCPKCDAPIAFDDIEVNNLAGYACQSECKRGFLEESKKCLRNQLITSSDRLFGVSLELTGKLFDLKDANSEINRIKVLYNELLMAVASKHEGETRHQTALRYITERENRVMTECSEAKEAK